MLDAIPHPRGTWACPILVEEPHPPASDSRWTGPFFKNEAAAPTCARPLFRTSVSLTAPTNLRRSLRNVDRTHRVPGSWTTRVLAGSLPTGTMLNSPLPNQPIRRALSNRRCPRAHKPKGLLSNPASARRLGAPW
ncbi:uncharacterized protein TrAtP1_001524 [Trichoderma atroviride]|uniref:uncharacterized protein n=1 Tax=Hypocrea atroviridis TaxID=63577 RepID=UPI00331CF4BA|nr:hypothetical protein TrAtP1_001524 [Trichoderma atroviride]